jgi:hypothetical protein
VRWWGVRSCAETSGACRPKGPSLDVSRRQGGGRSSQLERLARLPRRRIAAYQAGELVDVTGDAFTRCLKERDHIWVD